MYNRSETSDHSTRSSASLNEEQFEDYGEGRMETTILAAPVQTMRSALMDVQIWDLLFPPGMCLSVSVWYS